MGRTKNFDPDVAVERAMDQFWTNGYAGTTPQQLVDALGIGRGSLYNAFESKYKLYLRALEHYLDTENSQLFETLDAPGSARERLHAALNLVVEAALNDKQRRGCMVTNAAVEFAGRDPGVDKLVRRIFDRQEAAFRGVIEAGKGSGELGRDLDAADAAAFLLATINGIRVLGKADPGPRRLRHLAETALRAL
ncbi:TetR/AcrR family transcriptional regulator [Amycolatopsis samaneae]|uniref:TetR/AcrR family transcriptional regulator n=1 Tax=Amycolatopsis samaneae TaxID=664691 RepID=A0ABW5G8V5_9PSEU